MIDPVHFKMPRAFRGFRAPSCLPLVIEGMALCGDGPRAILINQTEKLFLHGNSRLEISSLKNFE
jgi:hypothetical protein